MSTPRCHCGKPKKKRTNWSLLPYYATCGSAECIKNAKRLKHHIVNANKKIID